MSGPVEDRSGRGRLVVLCGLPGSGKTTAARALVADGGVRLCPDDWLVALGLDLWDVDRRARMEALQWELAQTLLASGVLVVVEWGTWTRAEREVLRQGARALGASVELHHLGAPVEELWRRVSARGREDPPITRRDLEEWAQAFEAPDAAERAGYDPPPPASL
jgi:predicted kinase